MSRPKSINSDRENCRDLKISAFLNSLSRSRSRSAWIFAFYFLVKISQSVKTFHHFQTQKVSIMSRFLDKSCWVLTNLDQSWCVSTNLDNLNKNLDTSKSWLKSLDWKNLNQEKKFLVLTWWIILTLKKVDLDTKDNLDLDLNLSWLSRPPSLILILKKWCCVICT